MFIEEMMGKCIVLVGNVETFGRFNLAHSLINHRRFNSQPKPTKYVSSHAVTKHVFSAVQKDILKALLKPTSSLWVCESETRTFLLIKQ